MILTERHKIQSTPEIIKLCTYSKLLFNKCNYYLRKNWFSYQPLLNCQQLIELTKHEEFYINLHNTKTAKQTIKKLLTDWSNFFKSLKAWKKDPTKFKKQPKPPKYKKKLNQVIFDKETIKNGRSKK